MYDTTEVWVAALAAPGGTDRAHRLRWLGLAHVYNSTTLVGQTIRVRGWHNETVFVLMLDS